MYKKRMMGKKSVGSVIKEEEGHEKIKGKRRGEGQKRRSVRK